MAEMERIDDSANYARENSDIDRKARHGYPGWILKWRSEAIPGRFLGRIIMTLLNNEGDRKTETEYRPTLRRNWNKNGEER